MNTNRILCAITAIMLLGCTKENADEPMKPENADFKGTVTVIYQDQPFDNEGIVVNFIPSDDGITASITLQKIRFVPQMPVTIDVTIPDVKLVSSPTEITLSCEETIPLAMGGEYPRYKVTGLTGKLSGQNLEFSLKFGDYPTSYKGTRP